MYLIAGLGNPGKKYEDTRHNIGFRVISELASQYRVTGLKNQKNGLTGTFMLQGEKFMLCEPLTFMNNSGQCIAELMRYYNIPIENLIVIYDDIDLPAGDLRIRGKGSPGSHNGLKSITAHLGTRDFARVRVGIGAQKPDQDLADYVLSRFPKSELPLIEKAVAQAGEAAVYTALHGAGAAMNEYNGRFKTAQKEAESTVPMRNGHPVTSEK
jgi:PTH1 family peptidyl-tRNA hydrolase